ncbi:MAG: mandelate racemase/muconate lactonizing enzyme family protein, partial [Albidovulum sp.]|nr:mandelate racemase/muconate lactonizing enzyme family protein [Albidovulum sp.]
MNKAPSLARLEIFCLRYRLETPLETVFGELASRPALLIRLEDAEGAEGWGEIWCNFPPHGAEYRANLASSVLRPALAAVDTGSPSATFGVVRERLHSLALQSGEGGPADQIASGADIALHDLAARRAGVPVSTLLGGNPRTLNCYASGIDGRQAPRMISESRNCGYRAFKIRVGFDRESDVQILENCSGWLEAGETLAIDANQNWTCADVLKLKDRLNDAPLLWIEEPLRADRPIEEWSRVAEHLAHPIAAGENMRSDKEFDRALSGRVFGVIQPDVCKWGGVSGCLDIARRSIAAGKRYCPHFLGCGLGLVASAHLLSAAGGDGLLEVDANDNGLREAFAGTL